MEILKGYILQSELCKKANVSTPLFPQLDVVIKKMGRANCILKESLPNRYKKYGEQCLDLGNYYAFTPLSTAIGMCEDYLSQVNRYKDLEVTVINKVKLLKLSDDFIENVEKGLSPFKIKYKDDEQMATCIVDMQGIKIGFY